MVKTNAFAVLSLLACVSGLVLSGCGGGSGEDPGKAYEGRWRFPPVVMAIEVNLRGDGTWHIAATDAPGADATCIHYAQRGAYLFLPAIEGSDQRGTLHLLYSQRYDPTTDGWVPMTEDPFDVPIVVDPSTSPKTMTWEGNAVVFVGGATDIPAAFSLPECP